MSRLMSKFRPRGRALAVGAALAVSALAVSAGSLACAHGDRGGEGRHGAGTMAPMAGLPLDNPQRLDRMLDRMTETLNLQPAQRDRLRQIAQGAAQDLAPLREQARQLHEQRRRLWTQPTLDEAAITAMRQRTQALHEQMSARTEKGLLEAARVLTPEQRQQLAERMARRGEHRHGGHHGHRGERQGDGPHGGPDARS